MTKRRAGRNLGRAETDPQVRHLLIHPHETVRTVQEHNKGMHFLNR